MTRWQLFPKLFQEGSEEWWLADLVGQHHQRYLLAECQDCLGYVYCYR